MSDEQSIFPPSGSWRGHLMMSGRVFWNESLEPGQKRVSIQVVGVDLVLLDAGEVMELAVVGATGGGIVGRRFEFDTTMNVLEAARLRQAIDLWLSRNGADAMPSRRGGDGRADGERDGGEDYRADDPPIGAIEE